MHVTQLVLTEHILPQWPAKLKTSSTTTDLCQLCIFSTLLQCKLMVLRYFIRFLRLFSHAKPSASLINNDVSDTKRAARNREGASLSLS